MRAQRIIFIGTVLVAVVLAVSGARAGILQNDLNAYNDGTTTWRGRVPYLGLDVFGGLVWAADIEYCVYAPGSFDTSWGEDSDPSGDQHYVYAYQIFNNLNPYPTNPAGSTMLPQQDFVNKLTIGTRGEDEQVADNDLADSYVDDVTGDRPPTIHRIPIDRRSVIWEFGGAEYIDYGHVSEVLLFTSPAPPEWDQASLIGRVSTRHDLPSPAPEPGTLVLLSVAVAALLSKAKPRR